MSTGMTADDWGRQYRLNRGTYESFALRLKALISDLLQDSKIDVIQVEARAKDVDSFVEKIRRKGNKYENPLDEITDLVGIRVITYYREDVARVGDILRLQFSVDEKNSVDKTAALDPDRFGYTSVHHIVGLSTARSQLAEWKTYAKIAVEIQVRTALQHAWAAVNHKLDYKAPAEVPNEIRRRLFRLSALFELADEQFSNLRDERDKLDEEYRKDVIEGQLNIPLTESSLTAYLQTSPHLAEIVEVIKGSGYEIVIPDPKRAIRDQRDLLSILSLYKIHNVVDLDRFLGTDLRSETIPASFVKQLDPEDTPGLEDVLTQLVMIAKSAGKDVYKSIYNEDGWEAFAATVAEYRSATET